MRTQDKEAIERDMAAMLAYQSKQLREQAKLMSEVVRLQQEALAIGRGR
jgi:hypothetical protein